MMIKKNNCTLEKIGEILLEANSVLIFPHIQIDGDALGSSVALCRALRKLEKRAYILVEEDLPSNLKFLDDGFTIEDENIIPSADVSIAVDCSDLTRLENRKDSFFYSKTTISIDHHLTGEPFAEKNYLDPEAAATGEIIYELLKTMGVTIDACIGEALFAAITTDTGNFQYSNTTQNTHLITARLYDSGMDHNKVTVEIYQNIRPEKVQLAAKVLSSMKFFCRGKANIAYITQEMLNETGASMNESEGIVEQLRNINGVEISAILKEEGTRIKVGMRSKTNSDVASIAKIFGGGGHKKAAGFTIEASLEHTLDILKLEIEKHLTDLEEKGLIE